jgi:2-dehydro-3-deoxygluconokinase
MKDKSQCYVSFGEILLRLNPLNKARLLQNPYLEAKYAGSEANVAISLANFGLKSKFITALPKNELGEYAIRFLRSFGVGVSSIIRQGNRLGLFFLENGAGLRPSKIIYDRTNSSISTAVYNNFDWEKIFFNAKWFHISGITPALSSTAADLSFKAIKEAKKRNITISCDLNFRNKLWNYGKKPFEIMRPIIKNVDILIANEEDIQKTLKISFNRTTDSYISSDVLYKNLVIDVISQFPNLKCISISLRESISSDNNKWSGMLYTSKENQFYKSKTYHLKNIIDRVGSGDSFAAGLIYGLNFFDDPQKTLDFAVGASALKHTIPGDINLVSLDEIKSVILGNLNGRIQR